MTSIIGLGNGTLAITELIHAVVVLHDVELSFLVLFLFIVNMLLLILDQFTLLDA